ncbi:MAG TPA: hypothetical protein ENJ04_06380, partial [Nitrospirae bacterium]|nr:hypothetical protein [Nitrospirota bacterium]
MERVAIGGTKTNRYVVLLLGFLFLFLYACGQVDESGLNGAGSSGVVGDTTAPAAIVNLSALPVSEDSIELNWSAPGDDGNSGTASSYDVRYGTSITDFNWEAAAQVTNEPKPETAGTRQSMIVTGLSTGTTYYFAIRAYDEASNASDLSNFAVVTPGSTDTTPPAAVNDLRASNPTSSTIELSWTAPGDDGDSGTASGYDIRYSTEA